MTTTRQAELRERDSMSLLIIGTFFMVLAVMVLAGALWATELDFAVGVNLGAGWALMLVGLGMVLVGWRWQKPPRRPPDETAS